MLLEQEKAEGEEKIQYLERELTNQFITHNGEVKKLMASLDQKYALLQQKQQLFRQKE